MEINNKFYNDEILEFPINYEEIANLALLNFERSNKENLNKLIKKDIKEEQNNINENFKKEGEINDNEANFCDCESDEEDEKNINANYQKFEDEECFNEEDQKYEIKKNNEEIIYNKNIIFEDIGLIKDKEDKNDEINDEKNIKNNNEIKFLKEKNKFKKKKLSNEEIKKMISKIEFTPPNWGRNLSDKEFIDKAKTYNKFYS